MAKTEQNAAKMQHRQEKQAASAQKKSRKSYARLYRLISEGVLNVFPDLKIRWNPYDEEDNAELEAQMKDIFLVLRYFASRPQVLKSIKSGILRV